MYIPMYNIYIQCISYGVPALEALYALYIYMHKHWDNSTLYTCICSCIYFIIMPGNEARVTYDHLLPLHKRQCLVTIIFTNLPSLHPFSFHEMIFILVPPLF